MQHSGGVRSARGIHSDGDARADTVTHTHTDTDGHPHAERGAGGVDGAREPGSRCELHGPGT